MALGWASRVQVGYWRDSASLFRHAVDVTFGNYVMHEKLGKELAGAGKTDEAIAQFAQAVRFNRSYLPARVNLARFLFMQGRRVEAFALQSESISLFPHNAQLMCDAGVMLADAGRKGQAATYLMQALWLDPELAEAHFRLGAILADAGKIEDACTHLEAAVRLMPDSVQARDLLDRATAARKKGKKR
jgi:tetratricopeptide (TPR) repeat protein